MTDQPSQRAMKAAKEIIRDHIYSGYDVGIQGTAKVLDAEFPAYLEIREALEQCMATMKYTHDGHCGKSGDDDLCRTGEVIAKAEAALAKARKD